MTIITFSNIFKDFYTYMTIYCKCWLRCPIL